MNHDHDTPPERRLFLVRDPLEERAARLLLPPQDVDDLAERLAALVQDHGYQLVDLAVAHAEEESRRFTWPSQLARYLAGRARGLRAERRPAAPPPPVACTVCNDLPIDPPCTDCHRPADPPAARFRPPPADVLDAARAALPGGGRRS
jgi:hypothetical protein